LRLTEIDMRSLLNTRKTTKMTDLELLKFYMALIQTGKILVGSAGYNRMVQIKERVKQRQFDIRRNKTPRAKAVFDKQKTNVELNDYIKGFEKITTSKNKDSIQAKTGKPRVSML
tara:strand:+ start:250 stop:594 length:345 start_codon:yes stop_codon:yes gene_type:complete